MRVEGPQDEASERGPSPLPPPHEAPVRDSGPVEMAVQLLTDEFGEGHPIHASLRHNVLATRPTSEGSRSITE